MAKRKKWMASAVPKANKGKFTAKAARAGKSVHEFAEKEKHAGGTLGHEANFALNAEHVAAKKKPRRLRDTYKKKG